MNLVVSSMFVVPTVDATTMVSGSPQLVVHLDPQFCRTRGSLTKQSTNEYLNITLTMNKLMMI